MATGYTRQEAGNIVTGNTIQASHFNNEYNALQSAFDASTGHDHDGTVGGGAQVPLATGVTGSLTVPNGGTGLTTATDGGILLGSGTGAFTATAQPTNGQLLIGSTGVDPVLATLTDGTFITITEGAGTITLEATVDLAASFPTDSGTATPTANALTFTGGEGIDTSGSGTTITIAAEDATSSNKGIASFNVADFVVASGDVTLEAAVVKTDETNTYSAAQTFADQDVIRPKLLDYSEEQTTPASSSGVLTTDIENGNVFEVTLTENVTTWTISNPPATGDAGSFTLILKQDGTGGFTFAFPASIDWAGGVAPTLSTAANAVDVLVFTTTDAGTRIYGFPAGLDMS